MTLLSIHRRTDKDGRIALLNCLAAYNAQLAGRTKNKKDQDKLFTAANDYYQNSDKIDPNSPITWCGKGMIHIFKIGVVTKGGGANQRGVEKSAEHLSQAQVMFENALECDRTCIPALLGKAAVLYNRRKYNDALAVYKEVLMLNPACPPEVETLNPRP